MPKSYGEWIAIAVILLIIGAILWPVSGHPPNPGIQCLSNAKQIAFGLIMYEADVGSLPPRDAWTDAIEPYHKEAEYRCPMVVEEEMPGFGYAFNSLLDLKKLSGVPKPEDVPMVYDSINYARNASDPVASLPKPGRHKSRNTIAYADGHAKRVLPAALPPPPPVSRIPSLRDSEGQPRGQTGQENGDDQRLGGG